MPPSLTASSNGSSESARPIPTSAYRYRLERFVQKYPDLKAPDVRPHHVEAWVDDYDFAVTSRRNYMRSVKRCMNWSLKQGFIDVNPVATLEIPVADHKEIAFTPDQVEALLRYIRNPSLRDLVITTIDTGCRPQESLRVDARHVGRPAQSIPFCVRFNEAVTSHAATLDTGPLARSYSGGSRTHLSMKHFQFAPDPHVRWCGEGGPQGPSLPDFCLFCSANRIARI